jgi:hypothetical protein
MLWFLFLIYFSIYQQGNAISDRRNGSDFIHACFYENSQKVLQISLIDHGTGLERGRFRIEHKDIKFPVLLFRKTVAFFHESFFSTVPSYVQFQNLLSGPLQRCFSISSNATDSNHFMYYYTLNYYQKVMTQKRITQKDAEFRNHKYHLTDLASVLHRRYEVVFIISGKSCHSWEDCPYLIESAHMQRLIDLIMQELDQLSLIAAINIYYGYGIEESMIPKFVEECNKLFQIVSERVFLVCEVSATNIPQYDYRYHLAEAAHKRLSADYYFLLDPISSHFFETSWSLALLAPLFETKTLFPGFGISFQPIPFHSSSDDLMQLPLGNYFYPSAIVLQKSHFQYFGSLHNNNTDEEELKAQFQIFPHEMINYLFYDLYHLFSSAVPHEAISLQDKLDGVQLQYLSSFYSLELLEDFYDSMMMNRRRALEALTRSESTFQSFREEKEFHFQKILHIDNDNIFFQHFCQISPGCISNLNGFNEFTEETTQQLKVKNGNAQWRKELMTRFSRLLVRPCSLKHYLSSPSISSSSSGSDQILLQHSFQSNAKVAVITAIYGNYESTCKPFAEQSVGTNFFCFSDNLKLKSDSWLVDHFPYHLFELYHEFHDNLIHERNSFHHNLHPINIGKFYKMKFHEIPFLTQDNYDLIIWVDGTIQITSPFMSQQLMNLFTVPNSFESHDNSSTALYETQRMIVAFEHSLHTLKQEVDASKELDRYILPFHNGFHQPFQPIEEQYETYLQQGYPLDYWKVAIQEISEKTIEISSHPSRFYGLWVTCFLAFHMKKRTNLPHHSKEYQNNPKNERIRAQQQREIEIVDIFSYSVADFLNFWFLQNKKYSTEDQISFVYSLFQFRIFPFSLPREFTSSSTDDSHFQDIYGNYEFNSFYIKLDHGF